MQEIALKLKGAMSQKALFMEEDFSLNRLSNAIGVSENYISETLSQCLHTNFFQFVNRYRVEAAKALLKESDKQVSTIALEVGFNTKSTFNVAVKKVTGETPTSYRS
jgi:AraC-like DNA-binding protein